MPAQVEQDSGLVPALAPDPPHGLQATCVGILISTSLPLAASSNVKFVDRSDAMFL